VGREVEAVGKAAEKHVDDLVNGVSKKINGSNAPQKRKNKTNSNEWSVTPSNQNSTSTKPNDTEPQNDLENSEGEQNLTQMQAVVDNEDVVQSGMKQKEEGGNGVYGVEEGQIDSRAIPTNNGSDTEEIDNDKDGIHWLALSQESEGAPGTPSLQLSHQTETSTHSNDSTASFQAVTTVVPILSPSTPDHRSQSPPRPSKIPKPNRAKSLVKRVFSPAKTLLTPSTTTTASSNAAAKGSAGVQKTGLGDATAKGK
jgi:hypothetical protein